VNYGANTSAAAGDVNDGAFVWSIGTAKGYRIADITDGSSNTLLLGEKHVQPDMLGKAPRPDVRNPTFVGNHDTVIYSSLPAQASGRKASAAFPLALGPTDVYVGQFGSWHAGVVQFAFADGTVKGLRTTLPAGRHDGQVIPSID